MGILEPELTTVNVHTKAENAQRLQLYTQAKALDYKIFPLAEKQKPLEHAVEVGNKGLAEAESSWASLFQKFQTARLPPPVGNYISFLAYFKYFFLFTPINSYCPFAQKLLNSSASLLFLT